jgi:hypothetical protein
MGKMESVSEKKIELTIRVSEGALNWAIHRINEFIADQPVITACH